MQQAKHARRRARMGARVKRSVVECSIAGEGERARGMARDKVKEITQRKDASACNTTRNCFLEGRAIAERKAREDAERKAQTTPSARYVRAPEIAERDDNWTSLYLRELLNIRNTLTDLTDIRFCDKTIRQLFLEGAQGRRTLTDKLENSIAELRAMVDAQE